MKPRFRSGAIGNVLRHHRRIMDIGCRALAAEIGLSSSTLCRIELGHRMSQEDMMKVLFWLFGEIGSRRRRK